MTTRTVEAIRTDIAALRANEANSRSLIINLSVEVLQRLHEHDDVDSANRLTLALSEANKKMLQRFFKQFSGHREGEGVLGKRKADYTDKDQVKHTPYADAKKAFEDFVESGMTIFQWAFAERESSPDAPVDLDKAAKAWQRKAKKAIEQGKNRTSVLQAALGELFTIEEVLNMLGELSAQQSK